MMMSNTNHSPYPPSGNNDPHHPGAPSSSAQHPSAWDFPPAPATLAASPAASESEGLFASGNNGNGSRKFAAGSYHELVLKRIRDIPSLPEVVNKIIQQLGKANTPASEIAKLISYDPGLTSRVLRMVNSAAYGIQRQVSSIQHGIMILGFNTVRGLVLSASIFKLFDRQSSHAGLEQKAFWEHSLMTALAAKVVAGTYRLPETDDAFSAGMLHDIGKVVLDLYFAQDYKEVLDEAIRRNVPLHGPQYLALEKEILGTTHTEIGGYLSAKWKLPVTLTEVIQHHHSPEKSLLCENLVWSVAFGNELAQLIQTVGLHHIGVGHLSHDLVSYFQLDEDMLGRVLEQIEAELETIGDLFESLSGVQSLAEAEKTSAPTAGPPQPGGKGGKAADGFDW
jgi:HD-like signal output (HDOD) protein